MHCRLKLFFVCKSNFCFHLKVLCLLSNRSCQAFKENGPIRMQHYSPPSVTIITLEAEQAFNCHSQLFCLQTKNFSKIFTGAKLPLCKELKCHLLKVNKLFDARLFFARCRCSQVFCDMSDAVLGPKRFFFFCSFFPDVFSTILFLTFS